MTAAKKEQVYSIGRHILSAVGGILVAYGVTSQGVALDITGSAFTLLAIVLSIADKSYTITMLEGSLRQILTTLGTFISFLKPELQTQIIGALVFLIPVVLGQTDKLKVEAPLPTDPAPTDTTTPTV